MTSNLPRGEPGVLPLKAIFHDPLTVDVHAARDRVIASGVWFIDIPRTSSSSIRGDLARRFGDVHGKRNVIGTARGTAIFRSHVPAGLMREFIGAEAWSRLLTFSIVRNPWDRIRSLYQFRRLRGNIPGWWSLRDYVHALRDADADTPLFAFDGFRYGCVDYLTDDRSRSLVQRTIRYEEREAALEGLGRELGCADLGRQVVQQAAAGTPDGMATFDSETTAIIGERYRADVETYGYSPAAA